MNKNQNHLFLQAAFRRPVPRTPVWMMRQAGRYLPQYQAIRRRYDFLTMVKTPEVAAEVTLQPVDVLGVDAAILFSDILVIPEALGMALKFVEGEGPRFSNPLRSARDVAGLRLEGLMDRLSYVLEAIALTRERLADRVPLIGFSGAPWTLAVYMIEGGASRHFKTVKQWRFAQTGQLKSLLHLLGDAVVAYCRAQIQAGAQAIQLFDSWAGLLDEAGFRQLVLPELRRIVKAIHHPGVPIIYFPRGGMVWLDALRDCGVDVMSVDWTLSLGRARAALRNKMAVQGNLDPTALYAPPPVIRQQVRQMLADFGQGTGHIANLGHGILPDVPVEHARAFIEAVKEESPHFHRSEERQAQP